jgi:ancient ubiquitous protein 1
MAAILGVVVTEEGEMSLKGGGENREDGAKIIVANHISVVDFAVVSLCRTVFMDSSLELPEPVLWSLGLVNLGSRRGKQTLVTNCKAFCADSAWPLIVFPENGITSGNKGMLQFDQWPFTVDLPVQPLILSQRRPGLVDISPNTLGSHPYTDFLTCLFVPYTVYKLKWLPVQRKGTDESHEDFAKRVAQLMGAMGNLKPTTFTNFDVAEHVKLRKIEERKLKDFESKLDAMVQKVKDCLPQVPLAVIKQDLLQTRSADVTITNFLEGRVKYQAEAVPTKEPPKPSNRGFDSARDSFDQRKRQIIMENRRKYLERKGLAGNQPSSSSSASKM